MKRRHGIASSTKNEAPVGNAASLSWRPSARQPAPQVKLHARGANEKLKSQESESSKATARKHSPEAQLGLENEISNFEQRAEAQVAPSAADSGVWQGTVDDALLLAVEALNSSGEVNLSTSTLEKIVFQAKNWITQHSAPAEQNPWELVKRLVNEGVLSALILATKRLGHVPEPSNCLNPFGTSLQHHIESSRQFASGPQLEALSSLSPEQSEDSSIAGPKGNPALQQQYHRHQATPSRTSGMATPTVDRFLSGVSEIVVRGDAQELLRWLPIEPPFPSIYNDVIQEMSTRLPAGSDSATSNRVSTQTENKANSLLANVQLTNGDQWSAFSNFMVQYLYFIRDVNPANLLDTYKQLTELVTKGTSALMTSEVGVIMLPTAVAYAKVLARLALGLEKQPELIAHLIEQTTDEGGERLSLPERAANTIRQAFSACLSENAQYPQNQAALPIGRHAGIYKLANICLKIFFQCHKTKNAEQIFTNVGQKSPPLEIYPRSERATYLYYLGRFYFSVNHFYRAQAVLQAAYDDCHMGARNQRRLILVYLVTSNLILGKFPSEQLYQRPEARGFKERFQPICNAIQRGDLPSFRRLTDMENEHAEWFIFHRIFLQVRSRCEVLVWRSLCRRVWLLNGSRGDPEARKPPFLELEDLVAAARYLEQRALNPMSMADGGPGNRHTNWVLMSPEPPKELQYTDPDFDGLAEDDDYYDEGGFDVDNPFLLPGLPEIESIVSSLISQGLVSGYISTQKKLAVLGAMKKPALEAGWPNPWQTIKSRCEQGGNEIPGWKRRTSNARQGGMVVNLSGARPVGS